jgi:hypothetical protein
VLVSINVMVMSTWRGIVWSTWLYGMGDELWAAPKLWVDVLVLLMWNISYKGLYDVGYMLHNPFGNRRIDLAHETMFAYLRRLSVELGNGHSMLPPSCEYQRMYENCDDPSSADDTTGLRRPPSKEAEVRSVAAMAIQ